MRSMIQKLILIAAMLLLAACMTLPDPDGLAEPEPTGSISAAAYHAVMDAYFDDEGNLLPEDERRRNLAESRAQLRAFFEEIRAEESARQEDR